MKKIIILGNSIVGIRAAEELRNFDQESDIKILTLMDILPYRVDVLAGFVAKEIALKDVLYRSNDFYNEKRIEIIPQKKIAKINFNRRYITTEEKERFDFDVLIIGNLSSRSFPDIKGIQKEGVFNISNLDDIQKLIKKLAFVETVAIESNELSAVIIAVALRQLSKEVILITSQEHLLSSIADEQTSIVLQKILEQKGIRIVKENSVMEVLGEGETQAVKLKNGKVIAVQAVFFAEANPNLKILSESTLKLENGVKIDNFFRTNIEGVFAIDKITSKNVDTPFGAGSVGALEEQGRILGLILSGNELPYQRGLGEINFNVGNFTVTFIGKTKCDKDYREYSQYDAQTGVYKKFFVENDHVIGSIFLNTDSKNIDKIKKFLSEKKNVAGLEHHLLDDNISFEDILALEKRTDWTPVPIDLPTEQNTQPTETSQLNNNNLEINQ